MKEKKKKQQCMIHIHQQNSLSLSLSLSLSSSVCIVPVVPVEKDMTLDVSFLGFSKRSFLFEIRKREVFSDGFE